MLHAGELSHFFKMESPQRLDARTTELQLQSSQRVSNKCLVVPVLSFSSIFPHPLPRCPPVSYMAMIYPNISYLILSFAFHHVAFGPLSPRHACVVLSFFLHHAFFGPLSWRCFSSSGGRRRRLVQPGHGPLNYPRSLFSSLAPFTTTNP